MRFLLCFLTLAFLPNSSNAFILSGYFWESGKATYHVNINGNAPSGTSWNTAFKRAMDAWTNATSFQFIAVDDYFDPCIGRQNGGIGDSITGVDFMSNVCGTAFNMNVLAVTLTAGTCVNQECNLVNISNADIVFNSAESWDVYSGALKFSSTDFERVALHELGHALGLRHEPSNPAIMQALVNNNNTLQSDDINGANAIYGGPSQPPVTTATTQSIYGVDILLPTASSLLGPSDSVSLSGVLDSADASLDGKFIDLYQFTFYNDSVIDLQATSTTLDPFLYLVRVSSTQDAVPGFTFTDDNSGTGNNAQISTEIQAGTYWAGVSTSVSGQQGDYALDLISASASSPTSFQSFQSLYGVAIQINPNPFINGSLSTADFALDDKHLDLYQFDVVNQTTLRIDLSSTDIDTVLLLTRVIAGSTLENQLLDDSFLLQNDDFSTGTDSRIEQLLIPGTYWIGVTSYDAGETGNYQLNSSIVFP